MAAASKSHRTNNSRRSGSDIEDTITVIVVALGKAVAALVWLSVLFPMISIPIIASAWIGVCYGLVFGLLAAVWSGLVLVAGATGSGKGSVLWSIIASLAPGVRAGSVRLLVIDPKGGMEFGRGQKLFTGFAHDNGEHTLGLLRAVTTVMQQRAQRLRGQTRLHTPTIAEPLIVLIVDEIASLTAYLGDRKTRAEVEQLLGLLLSHGRAVGVSVIAAVQDPSKDVLPIRQLFSIRVGLRMTESTQTTMVLGAAAREAGAVCDQIPTTTPGVGYVCADGSAEPVRVRAFHVTDADIDYLATHFAPKRQSAANSDTGSTQP
jgi:S-DNA-T family DNA segregation ATPase FtsK/SpoIIIE